LRNGIYPNIFVLNLRKGNRGVKESWSPIIYLQVRVNGQVAKSETGTFGHKFAG